MSEQTVFSGETTTTEQQTTSTQEASALAALVGEGKKYKTVDDLAKAYVHADTFIENIKRENSELKEDLTKRLSAEQILEEIKKTGATTSTNDQGDKTNPLLADESKLLNLVDKRIEDRKLGEIRTNNIMAADKAIKDMFGDKAVQVLQSKSIELGVPVKWFEDMAAQSPQALFTLLGIDGNKRSTASPNATRGTVNQETISHNPTGVKQGTYKWFQELRKSNPSQYFTPKIQNEIMAKRIELGDKFYD